MKLSPPKADGPDINLTPMIDVVFLLLLFFMVSTSFIRESSLKIDLPEASGQATVVQESSIDIIINTNGHYIINNVILENPSLKQLSTHLQQAVGDNKEPHIIISADANAKYHFIVTAMDIAQQLGYSRLTLATRQTTKESQ